MFCVFAFFTLLTMTAREGLTELTLLTLTTTCKRVIGPCGGKAPLPEGFLRVKAVVAACALLWAKPELGFQTYWITPNSLSSRPGARILVG